MRFVLFTCFEICRRRSRVFGEACLVSSVKSFAFTALVAKVSVFLIITVEIFSKLKSECGRSLSDFILRVISINTFVILIHR